MRTAPQWTYERRVKSDRPYKNLPNAITFLGYCSQLIWVVGGHAYWPAALVGLIADEVDGLVARLTGDSSEFGSMFDWGTDLTMTGIVALRAGMVWTLPFTTLAQVVMRVNDTKPACGSMRAVYTIIAIGRGR